MNDSLSLLASLAAGLLLGMFYFSALWETVRRLPDSRHPFRALAVSFAVRVLAALAGFYVIMGGQPERLALAVAGFILMRHCMIRTLGRVARPT